MSYGLRVSHGSELDDTRAAGGAAGGDAAPAVVNDFSTVAVDGALVDRGGYAVAELASGCVCCTLSAPMQERAAPPTTCRRWWLCSTTSDRTRS